MDRAWRLGIFELRIEDDGRTRADILDPELMDDEFQRQLVWLVGLEGEACVFTLDGVNHKADFHGIRWRRSGIPGLRFECPLHVRARRESNVETLEANLRDVDGLSGGITQRRVKVKFIEPDEGLHRRIWFRNMNSLNIGWGPDAQAFALAPDAPLATQGVSQLEMEAIKFHAGVKAIRQGLDYLLAHKRLRPVCCDGNKDGNRRQKRKNDSPRPKRPAGYTSARNPGFRSLHLMRWMPSVRTAHPFSD